MLQLHLIKQPVRNAKLWQTCLLVAQQKHAMQQPGKECTVL